MICELECSVIGYQSHCSMMRENPSRPLKCRLIIFYKMAGRKTAVSVWVKSYFQCTVTVSYTPNYRNLVTSGFVTQGSVIPSSS